MKSLVLLFTGVLIISMSACDDIVDYYIGIPQQPILTEEANTNELNLFAILRPDSIGTFNKSFVFVQRVWPALAFESFSIIPDAQVVIDHVTDSSLSIDFPLMPPDSLFFDSLYRPIEHFTPIPGEIYRIRCEHTELNTAMGELVFPSKPVIRENSFFREGNRISFTLMADSLVEMYDIYLSGNETSQLIGRVLGDDVADTEVDLTLEAIPAGSILKIYSYEHKLAGYIGNSNIAINFNKFKEGTTTLESGFGVFGALNFISVSL